MILDDKEKLEAIEKIINEKAEDMDDLPWSKREKTNKLLGGIKQSEYEKILNMYANSMQKICDLEMFHEFNIFCILCSYILHFFLHILLLHPIY